MKSLLIIMYIALSSLGFHAYSDVYYDTLCDGCADMVVISGQIQNGDYQKTYQVLKKIYKDGDIGSTVVMLKSPGGDVREAIKIGNLIEKLKLITMVDYIDGCYSACLYIYVSGLPRSTAIKIGVHRPTFNKEYFKNIGPGQAEKRYNKMMQETNDYLREKGVSEELITIIVNTSSNSMRLLTFDEVQKYVPKMPMALDEWLISKCGAYGEEESEDHTLYEMGLKDLGEGYTSYLIEKINRVDSCKSKVLYDLRRKNAESLLN